MECSPIVIAAEQQARWWTYGRQLLGQAAPDPATALREVVGVYSSHPSAPLSLHARCAGLDAASFHSLDVLRLPAMRGSIHLLPRDTAHIAFRALPEPPARTASRMKGFGLDEARYRDLRREVLKAATEPRTPRELAEATGAGDELKGVTATMTREGSLVRVGAEGLRSNALRYLAEEARETDSGDALAWLVGEYLGAFGPARREDVMWWIGAPASRVDPALATVDTVELEGGLLLRAEDVHGFEEAAPPPRGRVDLLPKWDSYTMGYPADGRGRFADPGVAERCYDFRGDGMPVVLVNGGAAGTWALPKGRGGALQVEWFDKPGKAALRAFDQRADAVLALLG